MTLPVGTDDASASLLRDAHEYAFLHVGDGEVGVLQFNLQLLGPVFHATVEAIKHDVVLLDRLFAVAVLWPRRKP